AYLVRRLLENTSNQSFLRKSFHEDVNPDQLLAKPDPDKGQAQPLDSNGYETVGPLDFSKEDTRSSFRSAVEGVFNRNFESSKIYLGKGWTKTRENVESLNPSRLSDIVGSVGRARENHVGQAVDTACEVFEEWRETSPGDRADWLETLGRRLEADRRNLAALIVREAGKSWREADADVMEAIDFTQYYVRQTRRLSNGYRWSWPGEQNDYLYEPRGPTAVISPWNFPLAILTGMTTAALVTGNPVCLKPSSNTPLIAKRFVELAYDADLPEGVLQFLPGSGKEVGERLIRNPRIRGIAFTGSREVGLHIRREASRVFDDQDHMKQTVLELGGKNAVIVDRGANLDEAVNGIVRSAFGYQGQKCSACSRVIVVDDVADELVDRLVEATSSLRQGSARAPENFMGPVIDEPSMESIREYQRIAFKEGKVRLQPEPPELNVEGHYVAPMIVDRIDPGDVVAREEIFGPVLSIIRVPDIDRA
ncbi:MAG: aldehyde dehydrogenase family protein, partial [bacterium]